MLYYVSDIIPKGQLMKRLICKSQVQSLLVKVTMLGLSCVTSLAHSAVALDRTRIIFPGSSTSISVAISNKNTVLPYLAQAWIENDILEKVSSPFVVLPPLQRLEPAQASQIRIEAQEGKITELPQDRESLFYFNLREVPPKSNKDNVLQIALQSKIKLFYRPSGIILSPTEMNNAPWQEKLVLIKRGDQVIAKNPTAYYTTVLSVQPSKDVNTNKNANAVMIAPFSEESLSIKAKDIGNSPTLIYVNDYGGTPQIQYQCQVDTCHIVKP